jgi:hypothetical protein
LEENDMKKTLFAVGALALVGGILMNPSTGLAAGYGAAGCGIGSLVFGDSPGIIQVFAATTNGLFGSQTFGITSGTSNCAGAGTASLQMQETFVSMNHSSLSRDMAAGQGEYLTTLSVLMGCEAGSNEVFASTMKENHHKIFTPDAKPAEVLTHVRTVVAENATLAPVCKI